MSSRIALLLLVAVLAVVLGPLAVGRRVVLAHDLGRELGNLEDPGERRIATRRSDDHTAAYLPELQLQLTGRRSGWTALWNPHVGCGRPAWHLSGFSRAYPPTLALAWLTDDALVLYSWLFVLAAVLSAAFGAGFLRELGLAPAACLAGAAGLALGPFVAQRANAVMFVEGIAWTLGALWASTCFLRRPRAASWLAAAFATFALVLTGYPQQTVWHAYFVVAFLGVLALRELPDRRALLVRAAGLAGAAAVGLVAALPVLLDVRADALRSGRPAVDPEFLVAGMRELGDPRAWAGLVVDTFDPLWFGDPSRPGRERAFTGLCTGALGALLPLCVLDGLWRRWLPWIAVALFAWATGTIEGVYRFGIEHLGLGLSRLGPPVGAFVPGLVVAAGVCDHVLRRGFARRAAACLVAAAVPVTALVAALAVDDPLDPVLVGIGLALSAGVVAFVWTRSASLLAVLVLASVAHYGWRVLPTEPSDEVARGSPLVEAVRERTDGGRERFAWVGTFQRGTLASNLEALVGLASLHTYDPLASSAYRAFVLGLSPLGMEVSPPGGQRRVATSDETYGRHFRRIRGTSELEPAELRRAGVGLLLSGDPLPPALARPVGRASGVWLWRPVEEPVLEALVRAWSVVDDAPLHVAIEAPLDAASVARVADEGDRLLFRVEPRDEPCVLFVGQQHHPDWVAHVDGTAARTALADGFWQGVLLPAGAREVALAFRPHARLAWVPGLAFALAALGVAARGLSARRGAARARGTR